MKRLMTTAAMAMVLGTGAIAQDSTTENTTFMDYSEGTQDGLFASDLIGSRIYATEDDVSADTEMADGAESEWDDIGEINDIVLSPDGNVESVVLGVGGFLGIGERDVAIAMDQITFVSDGPDSEDYFLVVNASREDIENAPAYEREMEADTAMTDDAATDGAVVATDQDEMETDATEGEEVEMSAEDGDMNVTEVEDTETATDEAPVEGATDVDGENADATEGEELDMAAEDGDMDVTETEDTAASETATDDMAADDAATEGEEVEMSAEDGDMNVTETEEASADEAVADDAATEEPAAEDAATGPTVEREGYAASQITELTAEDLDGTTVYGTDDESIGEIGELLLDDEGNIEEIVVNVGGFLGIGEKPIAVGFDQLSVLRSDDGSDVRVYMDATEEQLEAQPRYEPAE
ncbi:PRC-barrel domain containing protein [Mesobaculum littorinae]|uniref:PRC-barrel domain containing protein n=1 Tax=Mesobaculum littorinae TaxID=2486419 RepID=A0A438AD53_9RHOB|nr:PRC-barrel domain-containing protein [Mesobaculum littorinae]RVV96633.1 PRC-barrel domain containing protein [Mesobaculum littorinae]